MNRTETMASIFAANELISEVDNVINLKEEEKSIRPRACLAFPLNPTVSCVVGHNKCSGTLRQNFAAHFRAYGYCPP